MCKWIKQLMKLTWATQTSIPFKSPPSPLGTFTKEIIYILSPFIQTPKIPKLHISFTFFKCHFIELFKVNLNKINDFVEIEFSKKCFGRISIFTHLVITTLAATEKKMIGIFWNTLLQNSRLFSKEFCRRNWSPTEFLSFCKREICFLCIKKGFFPSNPWLGSVRPSDVVCASSSSFAYYEFLNLNNFISLNQCLINTHRF